MNRSQYLLAIAFACGFSACVVFTDVALLGVDAGSVIPCIIFGASGYEFLDTFRKCNP